MMEVAVLLAVLKSSYMYNGPLLCGFNVPIKGLRTTTRIFSYFGDQTLKVEAETVRKYFCLQMCTVKR